jgi:hypothetical protein
MPLLHLYVAGGFFCLAMFYQNVLGGFINKGIIFGILISFLVFTAINSLFIQPIFTFNSYAIAVESVLVIILSLLTFIVMLEDIVKKQRKSLAKSLNWINSGLFIYYSSSLFIFYINTFLFKDQTFKNFTREFHLQTWELHAFFLFVANFCFFIGLWHRPRSENVS